MRPIVARLEFVKMKRFFSDYVVPFAVICGALWLFSEVLGLILEHAPADPVLLSSLGVMSFPQFRAAVSSHLTRHVGIGLRDMSDVDLVDFYPGGIESDIMPADVTDAAVSALEQNDADETLIDEVERAPVFNRGRVWVSFYEAAQCYGGPEEGGWYYDTLTLIDSTECATMGEVDAARRKYAGREHDQTRIIQRVANEALAADHHYDRVTGEPDDLHAGEHVGGRAVFYVESVRGQNQCSDRPRYE